MGGRPLLMIIFYFIVIEAQVMKILVLKPLKFVKKYISPSSLGHAECVLYLVAFPSSTIRRSNRDPYRIFWHPFRRL